MATRPEPNVEDVPRAKQVGNQRHREDDETLDRNRNLEDIAGNEKDGHRNQQNQGGHDDPGHVGSQIRMGLHGILPITGGRPRSESLPGKRKTKSPERRAKPSQTRAPERAAPPAGEASAARGPASAPCPRPG